MINLTPAPDIPDLRDIYWIGRYDSGVGVTPSGGYALLLVGRVINGPQTVEYSPESGYRRDSFTLRVPVLCQGRRWVDVRIDDHGDAGEPRWLRAMRVGHIAQVEAMILDGRDLFDDRGDLRDGLTLIANRVRVYLTER